MKELLENLPKALHCEYLLDTCFIIHSCVYDEKKLEDFCKLHSVGITSFTAKELDYVHHNLTGTENHAIRKFLHAGNLGVVDLPVSPGDVDAEKEFVSQYDPYILHIVPDPSDAVIFVCTLKTGATLLTKDKHHIFTAIAQNYAHKKNVAVLKEFP